MRNDIQAVIGLALSVSEWETLTGESRSAVQLSLDLRQKRATPSLLLAAAGATSVELSREGYIFRAVLRQNVSVLYTAENIAGLPPPRAWRGRLTLADNTSDRRVSLRLFLGDLAGWRRQYYDHEASLYSLSAARPVGFGALAAEHSLRKWQGLRPQILAKYGLVLDNEEGGLRLRPRLPKGLTACLNQACVESLGIDDGSCALCQRYLYGSVGSCVGCPLFTVSGDQRCDEPGAPYHSAAEYLDVDPMIEALERAVLIERERQTQETGHVVVSGQDVQASADGVGGHAEPGAGAGQ